MWGLSTGAVLDMLLTKHSRAMYFIVKCNILLLANDLSYVMIADMNLKDKHQEVKNPEQSQKHSEPHNQKMTGNPLSN